MISDQSWLQFVVQPVGAFEIPPVALAVRPTAGSHISIEQERRTATICRSLVN
jgi:hypothetical protein